MSVSYERARSAFAHVKVMARALEWWDYKVVPIMAVFYATVVLQGVSVASVWLSCIELLVAVVAVAFYVSVINDLTDRQDDRAAGKHNRLTGKSSWLVALLIAAPVAVGLAFSLHWRDDVPLVLAYLGAWTAFSLYSWRPFRLKVRGGFGVVADASGAHLFPTLAAALLAYRATGAGIDPVWLVAVAAWAFAAGLRGILWHQLFDFENDRRAGTRTFVVRRSPRVATLLARYGTFPIELAALAVMLWRLHGLAPLVCLALYLALAVARSRLWGIQLIIATPCERFSIIGYEYYSFLLPLGILLLSAAHFPIDLLVLGAHLLLFRATALLVLRDGSLLIRGLHARLRPA